MAISAPIYSQFLQKGESDNYDLYYLENDDKATKLSEQIGSTPAGSTLVTLLKALWTQASKAGVTSVKVGDNEPENGAVVVTLEKLGTVAITSDKLLLIDTNKQNIDTLTSNLNSNTYGFAKKSDIASVLRYKGTVASESALPSSNNQPGDVYLVTDKGCEHIWNGTKWEEFGPTIDLSPYITSSQLTTQLNSLHTTITGEIEAVESSLESLISATESKITNITNGTTKVGKATTADKLATPRTISLSGDVTGSASFDGSSNVAINAIMKDSGVSAGTYSAVKVNSKGVVLQGQQAVVFANSLEDSSLNNLVIGGIAVIGA